MSEAKPVLWRADPLVEADLRLACSVAMHKHAGLRGYSCTPKKSHINRGTYYAEINQHAWEGRQPQSGLIRPNVALGVGTTPLLAAMDGYQKVGLNDLMMRAIYLEIDVYYIGEAVRSTNKLESALAMLDTALDSFGLHRGSKGSLDPECLDCIGMLNPHGCYCRAIGAPPGGPLPDEDDDL